MSQLIPILTSVEMKEHERLAIEKGEVHGLQLQEQAAYGTLQLVPEHVKVILLCGPGNNGADALALARLIHSRGRNGNIEAVQIFPSQDWKGEAAKQKESWLKLGKISQVSQSQISDYVKENVQKGAWFVDGIFGIGCKLPLPALVLEWVEALNQNKARVIALDLPTGLDPSSPDLHSPAIKAERTGCYGFLKVCHGLMPAKEFCGEITMIPLELKDFDPHRYILGVPQMQKRPWNSHKGFFGHVAIRAGTKGMSGAAVIAATGALRAGAGLVTMLVDPEIRAEIAMQVPEAMVQDYNGSIPDGIDVLLVGPGGVTDIPHWEGKLVVDASALKEGEGEKWMQRPNTIITPHAGEFSRLFELAKPESIEERIQQATKVARGPGVLLLKGAQTIIVGAESADIWINTTGHPGLAVGGSGDFLSGVVAGVWAQNANWFSAKENTNKQAAAVGAWLHGKCADRLGAGPVLARDLEMELARLMRDLNKRSI